MNEASAFHPGVMIKCPGCLGEVPASQLSPDSDRPFRCDSCKTTALDRAKQQIEFHQQEGVKNRARTKSDDNIPNPATKTGRAQGGA